MNGHHGPFPGDVREFILVENIVIPGWKGQKNYVPHPSPHVGLHMPTETAAKHAIQSYLDQHNNPKTGFGRRVLGRPLKMSDFLLRRVRVKAEVIDTKTFTEELPQ